MSKQSKELSEQAMELTLRDYFAAKAMQGELACQQDDYEWRSFERLAAHCYSIADAMLKEREK